MRSRCSHRGHGSIISREYIISRLGLRASASIFHSSFFCRIFRARLGSISIPLCVLPLCLDSLSALFARSLPALSFTHSLFSLPLTRLERINILFHTHSSCSTDSCLCSITTRSRSSLCGHSTFAHGLCLVTASFIETSLLSTFLYSFAA